MTTDPATVIRRILIWAAISGVMRIIVNIVSHFNFVV